MEFKKINHYFVLNFVKYSYLYQWMLKPYLLFS